MGSQNNHGHQKRRPGGSKNKQKPLALVLMGKGSFHALKPIGAPEKKGKRR